MNNWFTGFLKNKRATTIQLLLVVGIAITVNLLADELLLRLDLTADNRYTLSEASVEIAELLVTVTAYFSGDLPPQLSQAEEEFHAYSGGNLEYRFVNPGESSCRNSIPSYLSLAVSNSYSHISTDSTAYWVAYPLLKRPRLKNVYYLK